VLVSVVRMVEVSPEAPKAGPRGSLRRYRVELPVPVGGASEVGLTRGPNVEIEV
jgi:hypothetical protein